MYEDITPTFYETNLELTGDVVIKISLFQIFVSLIKTKICLLNYITFNATGFKS